MNSQGLIQTGTETVYRFDLQHLREQAFRKVLLVALGFVLIVLLLNLFTAFQQNNWEPVILLAVLFVGLVAIVFLPKLAFRFRLSSLLVMLIAVGIMRLIQTGLSGDGLLFLFAFSVVATAFTGTRGGIQSLVVNLLVLMALGYAVQNGWLPKPANQIVTMYGSLAGWLVSGLLFAVLASLTGQSMTSIVSGLESAAQSQQALSEQLEQDRSQLEIRVEERTEALQRQARQLEAASRVAQELSSETDITTLLFRTTQLIQEYFGYYHSGIFLLDEKDEYAVLRAASSEGGLQMLEAGHKLRRGEEGIVGFVVAKGQPRIALDVGKDAVHFKNPFLPNTRSEVALPIRSHGRMIGALDIQSTEEAAFGEQEIKILQLIADQLAIAIDQVETIASLQQKLVELETANRRFTIESWKSHLGTEQKGHAYRFVDGELQRATDTSQETQEVFKAGQPVIRTVTDLEKGQPITTVAIPIKLRDQIMGVLNVRFDRPAVPKELVTLIQATAERMALSLETARLLEEVQIQAQREHVVGDISAKVRSATDVENILRTTALELGRTLGLSEVLVQLKPVSNQ